MAWFAIYECATGRLISQATEVDQGRLNPSLCVKQFVEKPVGNVVWDPSLLNYIPRPVDTVVDRFDDLLGDSDFATSYNALSVGLKNAVKSAIVRILGTARFRQSGDSPSIED